MDQYSQEVFATAAGRALAHHARDVVLLMRPSGQLVFVNDAAELAYGHSASELLRLNIRDLRAPASHSELPGQMAVAAEQGALFETEHLGADGTPFPVEVSSRRVDIAGEEYLLSVVRDVSARHARELEREELLRDIETANRQLEGLLRIVSSAVGRVDLDQLFSEVLLALREVMGADGALLFVVDGGMWRLKAQSGYEALSGFTLPLDQGFASQVAAKGGPLFVADVRESPYSIPEHEQLGVCSMLGVTLERDGSLFGVLECTWSTHQLVSESEQVMLQVAADRIMSAVGGATRYEVSRRAQMLEAALTAATTALSGSHDLAETVPVALEISARALECDVGLFGAFVDGVYVAKHAVGTTPRTIRVPNHPEVTAHGADLVHLHRGQELSSAAQGLLDGLELYEAVVLPVVERGEWFGALVFGRTSMHLPFDDTALSFARRFASVVAATHATSRDYEAEHRIAQTLQEALLSVDPLAPGLVVGHLYRSATLATRVGGDFYDVFTLPSGQIGVLVGDISGKGLEAAVLTTFVKHTIRAFAHSNPSPAAVLEKANEILLAAARLPEFASVVLMILDPETGRVDYCSAGHPPAIVRRTDGTMQRQECGSPVIGALPDMQYVQDHFVLASGDTVFLYTDGITEARSAAGEFYGDERLMDALSCCPHIDAVQLPEEIHRAVMEFTAGRLSDDIAIVAFRRP